MAYQKYKDIPNRREPLGGRDHIQHIENALEGVAPGPGEVIVGGADGPVAVHRAVMDPLPGTVRLLPPPKVMTTPPTITVGTDKATMTANAPLEHRMSLTTAQAAVRYWRSRIGLSGYAYYNVAVSSGHYAPMSMDFMHDGSNVVIQTRARGGTYRVSVNGERVPVESIVTLDSSSALTYISIDFGSRDVRHVRIDTEGDIWYFALFTGNRDSLWRASTPLGPRVVVIGDSWAMRNGSLVAWSDVFGYVAGEALGWDNVHSAGVSGSGYLNQEYYRGRMERDIVAHNPDIVLVAGGINDTSHAPAAIEAEAGALYDAIRAQVPHAALLVVSPFNYSSVFRSDLDAVRKAVGAAASRRGIPVIDTDGWITGSGQVGAETTTGNANLYIVNNHPNTAGQRYLGLRLATAILEKGLS